MKTKRKSTKPITQRCFSCQNKSVCQKLPLDPAKIKINPKCYIYALFERKPSINILKVSTANNKNIFQLKKRSVVSPTSHLMFYSFNITQMKCLSSQRIKIHLQSFVASKDGAKDGARKTEFFGIRYFAKTKRKSTKPITVYAMMLFMSKVSLPKITARSCENKNRP